MTSRFWLWVGLISIFLASGQGCTGTDISEPPKGYRNKTMLGLAYKLGILKLIETEPEIPAGIRAYQDITFKETAEKELKLDIYQPESLSQPTPLLIFIHGGSWKSGNKDDYRRYLVDFAAKGYVTATVSYRFSQEAPFPAAFHDVDCAVRWLLSHAGEYQIDPERVALIGGSAGAHLAMMVAYHAQDSTFKPECHIDIPAKVSAVVNIYGPVDLTTDFAISHPSVIRFVGREYSEETREAYEACSPLMFTSPDDPPTLTFHGTIDEVVPVSQADSLHARLEKLNIPSYYHRLDGWPHTMDLSVKVNQYCQYYMDEFFEKYLQ